MNPDDFVVDMDVNSMYASVITTNPCAEISMRVLKNRFNGSRYYKWKTPEPNHFEEHEELFEI